MKINRLLGITIILLNKETITAKELADRFQPKVLNRLYDDFDDSFITKNDDGSFNVEVVFPEDEWVYGYILSFGSFVEVLEPEHIRNIITDRMKQALKFYEK